MRQEDQEVYRALLWQEFRLMAARGFVLALVVFSIVAFGLAIDIWLR